MPEVCVIQHIHCETRGTIADALKAEGLSVRRIRPFKGGPVPKQTGKSAGLIIMGKAKDYLPSLREIGKAVFGRWVSLLLS